MRRHRQYTKTDMHHRLLKRATSPAWNDKTRGQIGSQAIHCPYYVPLEGQLGYDWGVIVNPESSRFGQLSFEHDDCGCPVSPDEDDEGWGRHLNAPSQEGDMWCVDWEHECDEWCDNPCEAAP